MSQAFSVDDLFLHQKVTEVNGRPGLGRVAYTVRSVDREHDSYISCIWEVALDGGSAPRQLTRGPGLDSSPRWSPDGEQLAFVSTRGGGAAQAYVLPCRGGEARQLGQFDMAVSDLRWAPDGRSLLVSAAVAVDPDLRGARPDAPPPPRGPKAPQLAWKLPYKSDGIGYLLAREVHLFRVDLDSGARQQLTDGPFDVFGFDTSPNGKHVVQVRTREGRFSHLTDLWVSDADGSRARRLTSDVAMVMQPQWSPDGRWILFAGARNEGDARMRLWLFEFATGGLRELGDPDVEAADAGTLHWAPDSARIYFAQAWRGRHRIVAIDVADGRIECLAGGDRQLGALAFDGERFAYSLETMTDPSEVHACALDGGNERCLTDLNSWYRERLPMRCEPREFDVPDGRGGRETIQGWLLRAEGREGPMPVLHDVHGGPAAYVQLDYDTNVFWQVLCAHGWAVLALDAVGSASYGREFCDRLSGHWGEYDLPQHLAALEQLQREGISDGRVVVSGKSYGGYLSGYATGHCHQFRAAVVMAPVGNIETHYGTSDGGYYADPVYMGRPQRFDRERARQLSPLQSIEKSTTPTLFMQGAQDERCPKCQSEELFVSLLRAGETPAELVLYPEEDHHFLGEGAPSVRADAARRIVEWATRHVAQAPRRAASQRPQPPQTHDNTETADEGAAG